MNENPGEGRKDGASASATTAAKDLASRHSPKPKQTRCHAPVRRPARILLARSLRNPVSVRGLRATERQQQEPGMERDTRERC